MRAVGGASEAAAPPMVRHTHSALAAASLTRSRTVGGERESGEGRQNENKLVAVDAGSAEIRREAEC